LGEIRVGGQESQRTCRFGQGIPDRFQNSVVTSSGKDGAACRRIITDGETKFSRVLDELGEAKAGLPQKPA